MTTAVDDLPDTAEYPEYAPAPETDVLDVDQAAAPRGVKTDGTPRRKPGPPKGSPARGGRRTSTRRAGTGAGGFPAPPKQASSKQASSKQEMNYAAGIMGLLAIPQGVLVGVGLLPGHDAYLADAAAVSMFAPAVADAVAQFARDQPTHPIVRWIDRAITVGPYAMFGSAAVSFVAQLMVNHGALPAGLLGTAPPTMLAQQMREHATTAATQG